MKSAINAANWIRHSNTIIKKEHKCQKKKKKSWYETVELWEVIVYHSKIMNKDLQDKLVAIRKGLQSWC